MQQSLGIFDVLSVESMISDLLIWDVPAYKEWLAERFEWCKHLFSGLEGRLT